jgi:hypothetical protein
MNGLGASLKTLGATVGVTIALSMVASAQAPGSTPATCTTAPTTLTALNIERAVPLANVLTTLTPNAPADILAGIAGGALEIREALIYNAQTSAVTSTIFLVPAGTPLPTPAGGITAANVVQVTTINITQILSTCKPSPSILMVGTVGGSPGGVFGSFVGAPAALSIGYTTDSPAAINNVALVVSGVAVEWSAAATGALTFPSSGGGTTGPPSGGSDLTAKIKLPNGSFGQPTTVYQVATSPLQLDASGSTGGTAPLTYAWSSKANSPVAFVNSGNPATVNVQFPGPGDYVITLTVTDATGATNAISLTFQYVGRPR